MNIPLNHQTYRETLFNVAATIEGSEVKFRANGQDYHLISECFAEHEGETVLIDSAFNVVRSDKRIGTARPI